MIAVLLAGGHGTRFWPLSRELHPKQFLNLVGDLTLIQDTFVRLKALVPVERIYVVTHQDQAYQTCQQLTPLGFDPARLLAEPEGRNTAPAIALAARFLEERPEEIMGVFPADHVIQDSGVFQRVIGQAAELAGQGYLTALGVPPTRPETGYGYIQTGDPIEGSSGVQVEMFKEKPHMQVAQSYLDAGGFYWNSGIYLGTVKRILEEIEHCLPELHSALREVRKHCVPSSGPYPFLQLDASGKTAYSGLEPVSIDYGVLEKSKRVAMVPAAMGWSDVGSWNALGALRKPDETGNVLSDPGTVTLECSDNIIQGGERLIAMLGVDNLIVVDTPDALLVCRKDRAQDIRRLVETLRALGREEVRTHPTVHKPWGTYTTLVRQDHFLVKRIDVLPGHQLSLQSHGQRNEHWVVVSGTAEVERNGETFTLRPNESTFIPQGARHRLSNPGPEALSLIEIQTGPSLKESDITRYEDDYGRAGQSEPEAAHNNPTEEK